MVKYVTLFSLLLFLAGCIARKNGLDIIRVPITRFSIKPNTDTIVYNIIGTASIYMIVKINGSKKIEDGAGNYKMVNAMNNGIKFYGNGRVARFKNVNLQNPGSLDTKKAGMGIYTLGNKTIIAQFVSQSKQGGYLLSRKK